ncbi:MAG: 30S ribosomal protein S9 [Desulfobacterales bacterium]|jgi:small subunit ribosomal protein S9|nr:30S ribosomal protein S9 [Desulfobacterales bacterium]
MEIDNIYYATGKRKRAVARTWLTPGKGEITVNNMPIDDYFSTDTIKAILTQPLVYTDTQGMFDIKVRVKGGGISGQAGAIRHGITKALLQANPDLRQILKKAGFVRRDPRIKERKKYGQKGARARFQFSKR